MKTSQEQQEALLKMCAAKLFLCQSSSPFPGTKNVESHATIVPYLSSGQPRSYPSSTRHLLNNGPLDQKGLVRDLVLFSQVLDQLLYIPHPGFKIALLAIIYKIDDGENERDRTYDAEILDKIYNVP